MANFSLNGRFIQATTTNGATIFLGAGTRDRILFDQQLPSQLISQSVKMGEMKQNIDPKTM